MKKEKIYNAYGIQYKAGKILSPAGEWIKPLLKKGNSKTGAAVFTYSQLAGCGTWSTSYGDIAGTCAGTCPDCYACAGFYKMKNVQDALALHTIITRSNLEFKKAAIIAQIKADKINVVRIHAAGDFDSIQDVNAWRDIVNACPGTLFWTYTKRSWPEIDTLNALQNINIVPSIMAGRVNYGPCADLLKLKEINPAAYICPCGFIEKHCADCKACALNSNVIFLLHSTPDYNAADDPLYTELKNIVINQMEV